MIEKKEKRVSTFSPSWDEQYFPIVDCCYKQGKNHLISTLDSYAVSVGIPPLMGISLPHTAVHPFSDQLLSPVLYLSAIAQVQSSQHASLQPREFSFLAKNLQDFFIFTYRTWSDLSAYWERVALYFSTSKTALLRADSPPWPVRSIHFPWFGPDLVKLLWFLEMETNSIWLKKKQGKRKIKSNGSQGRSSLATPRKEALPPCIWASMVRKTTDWPAGSHACCLDGSLSPGGCVPCLSRPRPCVLSHLWW